MWDALSKAAVMAGAAGAGAGAAAAADAATATLGTLGRCSCERSRGADQVVCREDYGHVRVPLCDPREQRCATAGRIARWHLARVRVKG